MEWEKIKDRELGREEEKRNIQTSSWSKETA